jgi:uncharacterized protein YebE (UPF0316 family)
MVDNQVFQWVILPALIFLARVGDVSLDTVRIILVSKGKRALAPILGFLQVLIWLLAIRQIFLNLSNIACYFAFAGGFATGTYVGMIIEEKLAIGHEVIRIITRKEAGELIGAIKARGIGVTIIDAKGTSGNVNIIYSIVNRKRIKEIIGLVKKFNPNAFYTIEGVRSVNKGVFPV